MLKRNLTFDVGAHTAYAFWQGSVHPVVGEIKIKGKKSFHDRFEIQIEQFKKILDFYKSKGLDRVIIESVELWANSTKSMSSATQGHLLDLTMLVGAYYCITLQSGLICKLTPAREWKGNLTKEATARRVELINNTIYPNDHITDAVGVGLSQEKNLWCLKELKNLNSNGSKKRNLYRLKNF